jgi:hypothetical protein
LFGCDRKALGFRNMDEDVDVLDPIDRHGLPSYPGGLSVVQRIRRAASPVAGFFGILGNFIPK